MAEQQKEFELPFPEAKIYTYYATEKPVLGNYPMGGELHSEAYEEKKLVENIGQEVWGEVTYDRELTDEELERYGLIADRNTPVVEKNRNQLYEEAMNIAGYVQVPTEPGSPATVTFYNSGTGDRIGFDGWRMVGEFAEEKMDELEESQKEEIKTLIYQQGRIRYGTLNLGGTGLGKDKEPIAYESMQEAMNAYVGADVDGKSLGVILNGEYTELASFDMVSYQNKYALNAYNLSDEFAINEVNEIQNSMRRIEYELNKDNVSKTLELQFADLARTAGYRMERQNSEWGSWFGRVANNSRPQDYIVMDITGYSTHHEVVYEVDVVHANEVVDSKSLVVKIDPDNFKESIKNATEQACEAFSAYIKGEVVEKLGTDNDRPFTVYSPFKGKPLEEHYMRLNNAGYEDEPSFERYQQSREEKQEELQKIENENPHREEKVEKRDDKNMVNEEAKSPKDQIMQELADGIKRTLDSKAFADWCQKQGKLFYNNYSFSNAMLTYLQKPDASYVCGYEKWKDFGRQVNKGAKGIKILAPAFAKEYNGKGSLYTSIKKQCMEQLKKDPDLEYATYQLGTSKLSFVMYKGEQGIGKNPLYDIRVGNNVLKAHATEEEVRKFIDMSVIGKVPVRYNAVSVFDISDTTDSVEFLWVAKENAKKSELVLGDNGKPITNNKGQVKIYNTPERKARFESNIEMNLPEQEPGKMQALYECLQTISANKGIPLSEANKEKDSTLAEGALGYYRHPTPEHPKGNIVIDSSLSLTDKVAVAFHEMAHSDLHADLEKLKTDMELDAGAKISRQMKEMQAEAVAYMTASTFGIETEHKSFEYIANWSNGRDLKELEESLNVIYKESQELLKQIEKELDNRGLTMAFEVKDKTPLSQEQKMPFVSETKSFILNNARANETLQKSVFSEMKSAEGLEQTILKEQLLLTKKIDEKLKDLDEKIELYEKSNSREEQSNLEMKVKADISQIVSMQGTVEALSEERVDVVQQQTKEDLKKMFSADPLKALKQMRKEIPQMKELSDLDIKLISKSEYVSEAYGRLLNKDNEKFAECAMKQLENLKSAMSKNGCVVEVSYCEQWTDKPIFEAGTVAHPKEANKIFAEAEKQIRALKSEAEKNDDYFPYSKCRVTVLAVGEQGKVTSFKERVDIGDGYQKDLKQVLEQSCPKSELFGQFVASTRERSNIQLLTPSWEHEVQEQKVHKDDVRKESRDVSGEKNGKNMSMDEWKGKLDRSDKASTEEKDEMEHGKEME